MLTAARAAGTTARPENPTQLATALLRPASGALTVCGGNGTVSVEIGTTRAAGVLLAEYERTYEAVFASPIRVNIRWADIEALFLHLTGRNLRE